MQRLTDSLEVSEDGGAGGGGDDALALHLPLPGAVVGGDGVLGHQVHLAWVVGGRPDHLRLPLGQRLS